MPCNPLTPVHYYHVWADGAWYQPVREHFTALNDYNFKGIVRVTLIGKRASAQASICATIRQLWPKARLSAYSSGYEERTLNRIRKDSESWRLDRPVLYMHAKGSYHPGENNNLWRQGMTTSLLEDWPSLTELLTLGSYAVAGKHYLTAGQVPGIDSPMLAGNFWWATAGHLANLPALPKLTKANRFQAEGWVTSNDPKVLALSTTWPNYQQDPEA